MVSCSDDVHHMTNESSAMIHLGHKAVGRKRICTNLQLQLQSNPPKPPVEPTYESLPLASSDEMKGTPTGQL
ncbi:unnamed protein product [Protopolystoma xenopodis]|uniref:Uncharacterized protein n=1 Tax=Protopolystoma xenopodis TaxID=117903 RepID=A0A3S5CQU3_9PLAT|nr:unnamed protein product [Protopolystoma xenopodis]